MSVSFFLNNFSHAGVVVGDADAGVHSNGRLWQNGGCGTQREAQKPKKSGAARVSVRLIRWSTIWAGCSLFGPLKSRVRDQKVPTFFLTNLFFSVFNHSLSFVKPKLFSTFQVGSTILRTDIQIASSYSNDKGNRTGVQCRYTWHEMELTNKQKKSDTCTHTTATGLQH